MGLLQRIFNWKRDYEEAYEVEEWNEIVYDRDDLQVHNRKQREEYVRGCLEQIAEASREVENLQHEYQVVTSHLKDIEEIEALPENESRLLMECAKRIDTLERQQSGYKERKNRMTDEKFYQMECMEEEVQEAYEKLEKAEEYQNLIKRDLRRLDSERQAYGFRKIELRHLMKDTRSMTIVCATAVIFCLLLLLILQYAFSFDVKIGYLAAGGIGALAITAIFLKYNDAVRELSQVESGISRLIRLQNTVKIRYVNNTHLLDYLYMKYNVKSAQELGRDYKQYLEEKDERHNYKRAEIELDSTQQELLHILRRYQVKDPMIWLYQTQALLDKKEMIEIRHNLIIRRQSLRRRMDYNKEVIAGKAKAEVKDLVENYPKYAKEILGIVAEYDE
ncbi:MAG: hypothetical protein DBY33_07050 [Lachnospiraceae bacterium]|nr:MAG: hypothetical protein DBY33_07050 [Lachnospiraceae bacterium]